MSLNKFQTEEKKETSFVFDLSTGESTKKRVQIHKFKGKVLMDIREFYNKDDDWFPTKKGVSLNVEQFKKLRNYMDLIAEAFQHFGENVDVEEKDDEQEEDDE